MHMKHYQKYIQLAWFFGILLNLNLAFPIYSQTTSKDKLMYFCTVSDEKHFTLLLNLIGSIHKLHFDDLGQIAVYDIGLSESQIQELSRIQKVKVYEIEKTNPDMFVVYNIGKPLGNKYDGVERAVRGWYSWKPVAIKQASELFPYFLYIDAGAVILNPINKLFDYIREKDFFAVDCGRSIRWQATQYIIDKFNLNSASKKWLLDEQTLGLSAGLMGVSHRIYQSFVVPIYELTHDIKNFVDDGTTPDGFGTARYDQPLFSILARLHNLNIFTLNRKDNSPVLLTVENEEIPLYVAEPAWGKNPSINYDEKTHVYQCRWQEVPDLRPYIQKFNVN